MTARWRRMRHGDLAGVDRLALRVHPGLPESVDVFANRLELFGAGCLVLDAEGTIGGYAVSHPIRRDAPPPLDTILPSLAEGADTYYIHDLVVAPERRGRGEAGQGVALLLELAAAFPWSALISVYGTGTFWGRFGFAPMAGDAMRAKLAPYGPDAVYMVRNNKGI